MKRQFIFTILLAIVSMAGQAQEFALVVVSLFPN